MSRPHGQHGDRHITYHLMYTSPDVQELFWHCTEYVLSPFHVLCAVYWWLGCSRSWLLAVFSFRCPERDCRINDLRKEDLMPPPDANTRRTRGKKVTEIARTGN